jgi:putative sigma-54 modulation protein
MKVRIRERDVALTGVLRAHVERRLDFALARFGNEIQRVTVQLSNGEQRDADGAKRCRIDVALRPAKVRVEDADADLFAAITHAAQRLSRSVARALERGRNQNGGNSRS